MGSIHGFAVAILMAAGLVLLAAYFYILLRRQPESRKPQLYHAMPVQSEGDEARRRFIEALESIR